MSTNVYRAIVSYSDGSTGEIRVRIPAKFGPDVAIDISRIGRTAYNGSWSVPVVGEQIVVAADDEAFTNVFWVQTSPASLNEVQASIVEITSSLDEVQASMVEITSFLDALAFGIFS